MKRQGRGKDPRRGGTDPSGTRGLGAGPPGGRAILWLFIVALPGFWAWSAMGPGEDQAPRIPYSQFRQELTSDNVSRVTVRGDRIRGILVEPAVRRTEEEELTGERVLELVDAPGPKAAAD